MPDANTPDTPSGRTYPISPTGLAHIPRSWIMGGPDDRSLCNFLGNIWRQRWGTRAEARRGCHACFAKLHNRVKWYEELKEDML